MFKKICTFVGQTNILFSERELIKSRVKKEIRKLITTKNVYTFYNGRDGDFNRLCIESIKELKSDYPFIRLYLVLAHVSREINELDATLYEDFDSIIYPDLGRVSRQLSAMAKNEWMVNKSNFLITYTGHNWGDTYKTLKYAQGKTHIKIIDIVIDKN